MKKKEFKPARLLNCCHTQINSAELCAKIESNQKYINLLLPCEEDETTKELFVH